MVRSEELRQYENLLKSNGFSHRVKNKRNAYIHTNWNDKRNIAFILTLCVILEIETK